MEFICFSIEFQTKYFCLPSHITCEYKLYTIYQIYQIVHTSIDIHVQSIHSEEIKTQVQSSLHNSHTDMKIWIKKKLEVHPSKKQIKIVYYDFTTMT